jgi:hypothetical protein
MGIRVDLFGISFRHQRSADPPPPGDKNMRCTTLTRVIGLFVGVGLVALSAPAFADPIIWTGPSITFEKPDLADWTLAINQDRLTDHVWLTRMDYLPLFNVRCGNPFDTGTTPCDTEWAFGPTQSGNPGPITATNYASLSFAPFVNALNAAVGYNAVRYGPGVLHLISDDIYLNIRFISWTPGGSAGGFAYVRSTPAPVPEPASATLFALGALAAAGFVSRRWTVRGDSRTAA